MAAVKAIFDPGNVLNPGVLVDPAPLDADLRVPLARPGWRRGLGFAYSHDGGDLSAAVHRCVGVGKCRADTTGSGGRHVPVLPGHPGREGLHPRPRPGAAGARQRHAWCTASRPAEVAESLDLCLSCKGCSSDCPAGVDMATYKAEVLYQRYRRRPRPPAHYSLGWLPRWARLASRAPGLANAALRAPGLAGLARRLGGIDATAAAAAVRRADLPRLVRPPAGPGRRSAAGTPVLLWVDTFTDYFTPEVGQAAVRVLEAAGYAVQITSRAGVLRADLDLHRPARRRPAAAAAEPARPGPRDRAPASRSSASSPRAPPCSAARSPSCCRTTRAPARPAPPPGRWPSCWPPPADWEPPDLGGVRAVAQPHCHHHAVMGWHADSALLARAGAEVTAVGGCCGLAGNFGVERGHYDVSRAVAETALLPAVRAAVGDGAAVVLADGFSCRTQLDQLARVSGTHLAQLLASRLRRRRVSGGTRRTL